MSAVEVARTVVDFNSRALLRKTNLYQHTLSYPCGAADAVSSEEADKRRNGELWQFGARGE
jgi:hypothetical protein